MSILTWSELEPIWRARVLGQLTVLEMQQRLLHLMTLKRNCVD